MNNLFKGFVNWTDTFFENTAQKLVRVCRVLSRILVWFNIIVGWVALPIRIIAAIVAKEGFLTYVLALLTPVFGYFAAVIVALAFALSIMTLNALSDINRIRQSVEKNPEVPSVES